MRRALAFGSCVLLFAAPTAFTVPAPPPDTAPVASRLPDGARSPAFAPDGRLAVSAAGDLWVLQPDGRGGFAASHRITHGPAWDRDPAWTPDGRQLVFASDRAGRGTDLWIVDVNANRAATPLPPRRLTSSGDHDLEPHVAPDGTIVFSRGRGGDADLWIRSPDGAERRLTTQPGAEREPAWSPDGARLAYVAVRSGRRELHIRDRTDDGHDTIILADRQPRAPAWAPDGHRIAFAIQDGRDAGVWTIGIDGAHLQVAGTVPGAPAWSPDGAAIVLADLDPGEGGYNGDPDRLGERRAGDAVVVAGTLRRIAAPLPLVEPVAISVVRAGGDADRSARHAAAYDRVWSRVARLYLGMSDALSPLDEAAGEDAVQARWREVGRRHRAGAAAASDAASVRDAIHAMLRERPVSPAPVGRAGVSSAHPLASAAGVEILERGGNVVDAAVAVSFALGVVEPDASGIGGYGEMLIHVPGMVEPAAIEFMTRVPEAATLDNPAVAALPRSGPGVANVPGTVAGMELAWRRYGSGRVTWADLLEPAIRIAERGFPVGEGFATTLRRERENFELYESSRALFFRDGEPLAAGDTLRNPDLAAVLRAIAEGGAAAFYRGDVGRRMVEDLHRGGNLMTVEDLRRYFAAERRPVRTTFRGNDVFSGPPPVTGGVGLIGKLNLLDRAPRGRSMVEEAATLHAMIEAWKLQPSTGGRIADPDLWPVDVAPFESRDTAAARWRCFDPARASLPNAVAQRDCGRNTTGDGGAPGGANDRMSGGVSGGVSDVTTSHATHAPPAHSTSHDAHPLNEHPMSHDAHPLHAAATSHHTGDAEECLAYDRDCRATGTTAFVVADAGGGIVSVTQTLGTWGGNFYVSPGLGFLYNDKLRSYGSSPMGWNARIPYARNTTVIAPTIVFRGTGTARRPWFGVGAAGNAWITSAVYQMVVGIVDHGLGAQQALELPRFLVGGRTIQIEDGFSPAAVRKLEAMGHTFQPISLIGELRMGYGAAVVIDGGRVEAGGDPRRSGSGAVTGGGSMR